MSDKFETIKTALAHINIETDNALRLFLWHPDFIAAGKSKEILRKIKNIVDKTLGEVDEFYISMQKRDSIKQQEKLEKSGSSN